MSLVSDAPAEPAAVLTPGVPAGAEGRPVTALPMPQLLQLSAYWFGLTMVFAALDSVVLPERLKLLLPADQVNVGVGVISGLGAVVAILVQPMVGSISDYTTSRWGRRKPYIVVGSTLDLVFLIGIATADPLIAIGAFYLLLQFSSNIAQGPFQGYVPDLVPAPQVGLASALVGVMSILGPIAGTIIVSIPVRLTPTGQHPDFTLATIALGVIELTTAIVTVVTVREGSTAKPRGGRSWRAIAFETWGRDVLSERSFVNLVASRLMILAGISMFTREIDLYLTYSIPLSTSDRGFWLGVAPIILGGAVLIACVPSARASDRYGRKPLIYLACVVGAIGSAVMVMAPGVPFALGGAVLIGLAAGTFLAVDWALMTDIIPKAATGRYMGLSNVATGLAGTLAVAGAGLIVLLVTNGLGDEGFALRLAFVLAIGLFGLGSFFLRRVDPTRREDAGEVPSAPSR